MEDKDSFSTDTDSMKSYENIELIPSTRFCVAELNPTQPVNSKM